MTKIINHNALVWHKNRLLKIDNLELLFRIMGDILAIKFITGVLGFIPENSSSWIRRDWALYLKGYIFNPITNSIGEPEIIRVFNNTFVLGEPYYNYLENEWYI